MKNDFEKLEAEIAAEFVGAKTKIESFSSGAMMLNVTWKKKLFILGYVGDRFGVDVLQEGVRIQTGLRIVCEDYDAARADLLRLLRK